YDCFLSFFFFSSRRRHTRFSRDWSSDVCSSDLRRLSDAFFSMGDLALKAGRHADAVQDYRKCLALRKTLDDPIKVLEVQERLGRSEERRVGKERRWRGLP